MLAFFLVARPSISRVRSFAMKTLSTFVFGLLITAGLATQLSAAPQFGAGRDRNQGGRDRVCFYQDISYHGAERCYNVGDEATSMDHNAQASSIRIYGRASVVVYEETNFRGHSAEFSSNIPDLKLRAVGNGHTWNDRISSLRVVSDYNTGRYPGNSNPNQYPGQGRGINDGICVYDHRDYQGREECFGAGTNVNDLARAGNWSDRIQSIRVFGGSRAVLYRDIQFRGDSIMIDRDVPDLSQVSGQNFRNWSRQISSLAVQNGRGGGRDRDRGRARF
jgi:Peptidase inhibitor family I36